MSALRRVGSTDSFVTSGLCDVCSAMVHVELEDCVFSGSCLDAREHWAASS